MKIAFIIFIFLTLIGPLWIILSHSIDFKAEYSTANRASTHLAPSPENHSEAIVQVYAARAFHWRGIFALHLWIAVKPKNATEYRVYQVLGWHAFRGLPALVIVTDIPDRFWFNQKPKIIYDARGLNAEKIVLKINESVKHYPYANQYKTWPGPNSNTFIAYIARQIPEMQLSLPSNAVGKDFTGKSIFTRAPSNTGYQISFFGYFGIILALEEGLEINLLGLVYGISPLKLTLKLPGFGDLTV